MPKFGDLDTSFGNGGKVTTDFFGGEDKANSLAINSDGKIIVVGQRKVDYFSDFALACYKPNGSLDASFGENGKVTTTVVISDELGNSNDIANSVAIKSDGKIIVVGYITLDSSEKFALACYEPNGHIDASFGINGFVTGVSYGGQSVLNSVAIMPNGNIIVAGFTDYGFAGKNEDKNRGFFLACYTSDGILDTNFGSYGFVINDIGLSSSSRATSIAIYDEKIFVSGYNGANFPNRSEFVLACFNSNGILDTDFGNSGITITDFDNGDDYARSLAIKSDGKIIVAGDTQTSDNNRDKFALACYKSDGFLDASFGINGKVTTIFDEPASISSVAIYPNGKIIVAGYKFVSDMRVFALACYKSDGNLETSFGTDGLVISNFYNERVTDIAINSDGNIIVCGYTNSNFVLACYYGENVSNPEPEVPLSSTCFIANTLISTNQGNIAIQNLDPEIHTIRNKKIELITKTVTQDKYLVCFEKDSLGKNLPSEKTIITKNHVIYYKGSEMKAKNFINKFENVKKIKYNGEMLYNVLLKEHDKMIVNNLICETLHPENKIGELYKVLSKMSQIEQQKFIKEYNDYSIKNNIFSSKR